MDIDLTSSNPALESIFNNPNQIITLDANFVIPPDRSRYGIKSFEFNTFRRIWVDPIFETFPNLAIHEAVYDELVSPSVKNYVDALINNNPPRLSVHKDSSLTMEERMLRDLIEERIFPYTKYDPMIDNKNDRGEVKSLSYIAVKELLYFAAHDFMAIQLIEQAEKLMTGLDNIKAVKMYEIIFYLYRTNISNKKDLRRLYRYQYHLTRHEKNTNPEWGEFIKTMESLYPITSDSDL